MKEIYITDSEREKCRKVADAFAELYEIENILVVDAGRYGFVKLQYYRPPQGFEDAITFTDSRSMFENLWVKRGKTDHYQGIRISLFGKILW